MKKFLPPLLLAVVLLLGAWYFWPRTLTGALSGLDQQEIALCDALLIPRDPGSGLKSRNVRVEVDSQEFQQLMELLTALWTSSLGEGRPPPRSSHWSPTLRIFFPSGGWTLLYPPVLWP